MLPVRVRATVLLATAAIVFSATTDVRGVEASTLNPDIVNGTLTAAYPSVGALLIYSDASRSSLISLCSGTLIGCRTFVTAAHCVCPDQSDDAASCEFQGVSEPGALEVFLPHGGILPVASVTVDPQYSFAQAGDLAVLTLSAAATGIVPTPLNRTRRATVGTRGTLVGFGTTGGDPSNSNDAGLKRVGEAITATCPSDVPNDAQVCWKFTGADASTCSGDSGGPLLIDFGAGPLLAGATSGGVNPTCLAPDTSFDTDVFVAASWIATTAGADLGTTCSGLATVGTSSTAVFGSTGDLTSTSREARVQFEVPAGTSRLRITLNSQLSSGQGPDTTINDFDLFVQAGSPPSTTQWDCSDIGPTGFGACDLPAPRAGTWHVLVEGIQGSGVFQISATTFANPAAPACLGDCGGDQRVTPDDLVESVDIALGNINAASCPAPNIPVVGVMTVADLLRAVNNASSGCPQ